MASSSSVDVVLEFLRRNIFARAEAALRSEIGNQHDLNGFMQGINLEEKDIGGKLLEEENGMNPDLGGNQVRNSRTSDEVSKEELIVKEIECGIGRNGSENKWKNTALVGEKNRPDKPIGVRDKNFVFSYYDLEDTVLDLYSWKLDSSNGSVDLYQNDAGIRANDVNECQLSSQSNGHPSEVADTDRVTAKVGEEKDSSGDRNMLRLRLESSSKAGVMPKQQSRDKVIEPKEPNCQHQVTSVMSKDNFLDNPSSRNDDLRHSSSEPWKDFSVKTVFPFPKIDASTSYSTSYGVGEKEDSKRKAAKNISIAIKEQVDEVEGDFYFTKTQGNNEPKAFGSLGFPVTSECQKEDLPRLPPVKLKSDDKPSGITWEEKYERDGPSSKVINADSSYLIGSFLDVPISQEISSSGRKRSVGGSWLSVSRGIPEDASDLVSGFATVGDGLGESVDFPNEYWDSDEYEDDDDVGYTRQPIEDETWFLAHEIDYPSDNEKETGHGNSPDPQERGSNKKEDDDQSFAEEDSYLSGDQYFHSKSIIPVTHLDDTIELSTTNIHGRTNEHDMIAQYGGQVIDEDELNLMCAEPVWQGFVTQTNELIMLGEGEVVHEPRRSRLDDLCEDEDQHGSVRSIGVGINNDAADFGSEARESLVGGSIKRNLEYFSDNGDGISPHKTEKIYLDSAKRDKRRLLASDTDKPIKDSRSAGISTKNVNDSGFSFPLPRDRQLLTGSNKALCTNKNNASTINGTDNRLHTSSGNDDLTPPWRQKGSDSSPVKSSREEEDADAVGSENSSPSILSNYGYDEMAHLRKEEDEKVVGSRDEDPGASLEDEEAAAVQEQVKQITSQEEEYETFNLKIVHRKNRTGFEEDKNFHVVLNSVLAGRYHVTEYLGSAAFSKAIQAHDLHTGMDVCVKIIKNNKDFLDQSLDEIKLLKFVNKHDPGDKYHLLRLYDYFYYRVSGSLIGMPPVSGWLFMF